MDTPGSNSLPMAENDQLPELPSRVEPSPPPCCPEFLLKGAACVRFLVSGSALSPRWASPRTSSIAFRTSLDLAGNVAVKSHLQGVPLTSGWPDPLPKPPQSTGSSSVFTVSDFQSFLDIGAGINNSRHDAFFAASWF